MGEEIEVSGKKYGKIIFLDYGCGIPEDLLNKIINPFFTTKPLGRGTGLGLSISYGIINDHGGIFEIDSKEGEFTKISILSTSLNFHTERENDDSSCSCVDDEESLRYTFHWFLTDEGYSVSTAETFEKAVEKINIESFDIVFADIVLHNQSGMDLLKIVKDKNPSCPVIMITGYPNIDTASEAVRLGAFDYIKKPVTKNVLLSTAKLALDFKAVLDENIRYRKNHEAIFRSVKDGIITVDKYLNITEFNEAAKRICSCIKEGKEKPFEKLLNRCNGVRCFMGLKQTIEEKKAVELHRMECRRKG